VKRTLVALAAAIALVGCASPDYAAYASASVQRSAHEAKRLENLATIAREANDPITKVAAVVALSHAESKNKDRLEAPVNPLVEVLNVGATVYDRWANTLLGVLQLRRSTSAISEQDAANAINILKPNTK
jgi:hypothetical protein